MGGSINPCLFCGETGRKMTVEDVYPIWLNDLLVRGDVTVWTGMDHTSIRKAPALQARLRDVCKVCNEGWMSDLEGSFRQLMSPAILGNPVSLSPTDQRIVATWAVKTWLLLERSHAHLRGVPQIVGVPAEVFRWLQERQCPPPRTQVWLGRVDPLPDQLLSLLCTCPVGTPPEPPRGVIGVFTVGCLVLHIHASGDGPSLALQPVLMPYLSPVWPQQATEILWPPDRTFQSRDIERIWNGYIPVSE